jgi:diadenosine tetraphosphate (Ap4A) HIT family hydrolase/catechol 2,3-dioxygenase-like lactoylglutathione lyase family enzyme
MRSGWAVMGQRQVLRGYTLLLPDPVVADLNALRGEARQHFLDDLAALGDAVLAATGALRINYAIFGNLEPALHAHVHPRYADEAAEFRSANPWGYDWTQAPEFDSVVDAALLQRIRQSLAAEHMRQSDAAISLPTPAIGPTTGALHHIDLTVSSLEHSTQFYDRWLTAMRFERIADCAEGPLWRGATFELGLQQARRERTHDRYAPGLHHVAFAAQTPQQVSQLHAALVAEGVLILDPPAYYEHYAPGYFAVFFADPDGIKLEYVFTPPLPAP